MFLFFSWLNKLRLLSKTEWPWLCLQWWQATSALPFPLPPLLQQLRRVMMPRGGCWIRRMLLRPQKSLTQMWLTLHTFTMIPTVRPWKHIFPRVGVNGRVAASRWIKSIGILYKYVKNLTVLGVTPKSVYLSKSSIKKALILNWSDPVRYLRLFDS